MKLKVVKTYFRVWFKLTQLRLIDQLINSRFGGLFFLLGKLIRLFFQVIFLYLILTKIPRFAGYNLYQALLILFFLNLTSIFTQMFLRGVYRFRERLIYGRFDFFLLNPLDELFYSLFSYFDPLDAAMLIPSLIMVFWAWSKAQISFSFLNLSLFLLFILIAFLFTLAWHILAISLGVLFMEVDNFILIYRDLEKMGRFPINIYHRTISFILTYFIPIAIMATIPVNVLIGRQAPLSTLILFGSLALLNLFLAFKFWRFALRHYTSASS